jgi:hypothetical protein
MRERFDFDSKVMPRIGEPEAGLEDRRVCQIVQIPAVALGTGAHQAQ